MSIDMPRIPYTDFPPEERASVMSVWRSLNSLTGYVEDFKTALALFDECRLAEKREDSVMSKYCDQWVWVAARDGGMTIWHFGQCLDGLRSSFRDCPEFKKAVNHHILRDSDRYFREKFPVATKIRHAIGHRAELTSTKENFALNALASPLNVPGVMSVSKGNMIKCLDGSLYMDTFAGESISYDISQDSLDQLIEIANIVMSAFPRAN